MSILKDMFAALKGAGNEMGEAIIDANAVRILEQEIREAEEAINKARQSLTKLKGTEIRMKRELNSLNTDISDYEAKAIEALNQGNEELALKVAERIAEHETDREDKSGEYEKLSAEVSKINTMIKNRNKVIQKNKRELEKVKTIRELQKTTSSISTNFAATGSSANRVSKALERVKKKQAKWKDTMEAGDWMAEEGDVDDLNKELKEAGIGANSVTGNSILDRLKAKQGASA